MRATFLSIVLAARVLARRPGATIVLLVTLALGIGGNAAVFSVLNALVLNPLPYPHSDRLVAIWETSTSKNSDHEQLSPVNLNDYRASKAFDSVAAWWHPQLNLTDAYQEPLRVEIVDVTDNFFRVFGQSRAIKGRDFTAGEDAAGAPPVVIISSNLWKSRYGGDLTILGQRVKLDDKPYQVVGIAPEGFQFPGGNTAVWRPLGWDLRTHSRAAHFMEAVGRLPEGGSLQQAQAALTAVATHLQKEHRGTNTGWGVRIVGLQEELVGPIALALWLLQAAVAVLLLISCANIANILLMQATAREREVGVRTALGASAGRLMRQFAGESLLLSLAGGALGLVLAVPAIRWLVANSPVELGMLHTIGIDGRVVGFAFVVAALTGLLAGLAPAWRVLRVNIVDSLKEGGGGHSGGAGGQQARRVLVVAEILLATVLAVCAGLLLRSFVRLMGQDTGMQTGGILTANIQLPVASYGDWKKVESFYRRFLDTLRANPRVVSADATNYLPLDAAWQMPFSIPGQSLSSADENRTAQFRIVGPDYFKMLQVKLVEGRTFQPTDDAAGTPVVVVSQEAARQFWRGDVLGAKFATPIGSFGPLGKALVDIKGFQVIGVVADAKNNSLLRKAEPTIYFSFEQFPYRSMYLMVKSRQGSGELAGLVHDELRRVDPNLALAEVKTLDGVVESTVAYRKFAMFLMGAFALLAIVVAVTGVYGALSYSVVQRRDEIRIRLALGAGARDVFALVVGQAIRLCLVGLLLGAASALALARFISSFLYGVPANDWVTIFTVLVVIMLGAILASWLPARRATSVDPATYS